jgi:hypothetical protein
MRFEVAFDPANNAGAAQSYASARPSTLEQSEILLDALRQESLQSDQFLRLGFHNREHLSNMASEIYSTFLSDMLNLCRQRARNASSIEEVAMHKVLTEHVAKCFAPKDLHKIRASLLSAAAEASLRCPNPPAPVSSFPSHPPP